jgi:glycosyltransferase involved in cell wall biosynthesis
MNHAPDFMAQPPYMAARRVVRLLHLHCIKVYGGMDTVLLAFGREQHRFPLLESHFAVSFEGRLAEELRAEAAPVWILPPMRVRTPWTVLRTRRALARYAVEHRIDAIVFHSPYPHALLGAAARRCGLAIVHWLHNETDGQHWLDRLARRTSPDLGISVSRFIADSYENLFPGVTPLVMWPPVSNRTLECTASERHAIRAEFDVPADALVILQACRFDPMKGHAVHLRALAKLKTERPWICWQAGGPQQTWESRYYDEMRGLAASLGLQNQVRFLGQRNDIPRLMAAADILCQPNLKPEPSGTVFIEAMYRGMPVVTTDMGGAVEGVDSSCGMLVPPNDPDALAQCLEILIENDFLRARLGEAGPQRGRALADPVQKFALLHERLSPIIERRRAA